MAKPTAKPLKKIDREALPAEVRDAYDRAVEWLADRFSGRRTQPVPVVVTMAIPEESEDAAIFGILVPPNGEGRKNINRLALAVPAARERGGDAMADALAKVNDRALVECLFWAGIPAQPEKRSPDGKAVLVPARGAQLCPGAGPGAHADPRVRARDFLRDLEDEPGSLSAAYSEFADQTSAFLMAPEVSLGKL